MSSQKLNVIVPYRNREKHKKIFIREMNKYLIAKKIAHYEIFIIEQDDDKEFNKGSLCNVGFLESNKEENYYCFNDVDTIPKSDKLKFDCPALNTVYHPYGHIHCLSNLFIINTEDYVKMNGFPTNYWSWGWEDTDIIHRLKVSGLHLDRSDFTERFKSSLVYELDPQNDDEMAEKMEKESTAVNEILFYYSVMYPEIIKLHGLSNTDYVISEKVKYDTHTHLKCKLKMENHSKRLLDAFSSFIDKNNALDND